MIQADGSNRLLVNQPTERMIGDVKENRKLGMPILLMLAFALTRWPGVLPPNFSAAYALVFCAAIYFPKQLAWWLPLATMLGTDLVINVFYYQINPLDDSMIASYVAYAGILFLGRQFKPHFAWWRMLAGGIAGALLFYLVTNTASWMLDSAYAKTLGGWIQALTVGTPGWPHTWEFFRNTLLSGGLFTGLFAGAMKLGAATEPEEEEEAEPEAEEAAPEESQA
jgi:hypothetical protein